MSNRKQYTDPNDPLYYAQPWRSEPAEDPQPPAAESRKERQDLPPRRRPEKRVDYLRPVRDPEIEDDAPPDIFAEAVARALEQEYEPEFVEVPTALRERRSFGLAAKVAVAVGGAALVALAYVFLVPDSDDNTWAALPNWQSLRSTIFPAPPRRPAPILTVQDSDGPVNEPLLLGISIDGFSPGATVTIDKMPAEARLTAGKRMSASEWRVPAQLISNTSIIPPAGFVGEMNLSATLRSLDGAPPVSNVVRLSWGTGTTAVDAVAIAAAGRVPAAPPAVLTAPPALLAAPPQRRQVVAAPVAAAPVVAATRDVASPSAPVTEPATEMPADELAGLVRRAQELLMSGDLPAARLLLIRATRAHDAHAALLLAKSYDPNVLGPPSVGSPAPDPEQARNWYQKAKEWGWPDAQRQLDALANYR